MVSSTIRNESKKEVMNTIDPGEEIVISGIAGRFPESDNIFELQKNLLNKVDLITSDDRRWKQGYSEIPERAGKLNNINLFDADFFGINFKEAHCMDPMSRMLLEHTFEAIVDAGYNPQHLRGTNTGVFLGSSYSETGNDWVYSTAKIGGLGITGCFKAFFANRISHWLGIHGPSYNVDTACSSSLLAMEQAYRAIHGGVCDAAIVGGANLCLHPTVAQQFARLGVLSPDGKCKAFDQAANGYVRSETVAVVFLQKAKDAKRIYATFVHAKTNSDGYKEEGITFPSSAMQRQLLEEFYQECGISPTRINLIEAHGTGTKVGDPEEVNALDKVFCKDRTTPLKIGSVKSNLGHSEPASGFGSIAKIIIAMESGIIPPTLHFRNPREELTAIKEGRITVVTEPTPWEGGYVGINSFGLGGSNCHILLKSNSKEKINKGGPDDVAPRLVVVSGRTEEAVATLLNDVESRSVDVEYVKLLHDLYAENIPGHLYRGYTILQTRGIIKHHVRDIQYCSRYKRPVWFVFTGLGSQWTAMGAELLQLPVFAAVIKKCAAALKPYGIDIFDILKSKNKEIINNIQNAILGIVAVQMGLVDLLTTAGIIPDNIIGHSIGELCCAYVDGCFTVEQTILAAYTIGKVSLEANFTHTSSAVVGLGYQNLKNKCPPGIEIAGHNDTESTTVCGPIESVRNFVNKLKANNVHVNEIPFGNIPYHSQYINPMKTRLLKNLEEIISNPKQRSSKWLCSSIPETYWKKASARLPSAEYYTNNLLNTMLFEETCALMPTDAVVIEIAPQALLHDTFRIRFNPGITHITLMQCGHESNTQAFFQGLGKLYNAGLNPQLIGLYPGVEYPVSRGTPMIAPRIIWDHSKDWYVSKHKPFDKMETGERHVNATLADEKYEYMAGHVIDGRNLIPATGYLQLIWETLALMRGELYTDVSVVFENVKFIRATNISMTGVVNLTLMIQKGTGRFEIADGDAVVVTGFIRHTSSPKEERMCVALTAEHHSCQEPLTTKDVYKELRLRGYQYSGLFRGIKSASVAATKAHIAWTANWVTFIDTMLQIRVLGFDSRCLMVPTEIEKIVIDTEIHQKEICKMTMGEKDFSVYVDSELDCIVSGGVEIRGLKAGIINRRKVTETPILEQHMFISHMDRAEVSLQHFIRMSYDLGIENLAGVKVKTFEVIDETDNLRVEDIMSNYVQEYLANVPLIQSDISILTSDKNMANKLPENISIVDPKKIKTDVQVQFGIGQQLLTKERSESFKQLLDLLNEGGFIITREMVDGRDPKNSIRNEDVDVIMEKTCGKELLILIRKKNKISNNALVIHINNTKFTWISEVQEAIKMITEGKCKNNQILLVGIGDIECGLLGLVTCLRKEPGSELIRGLLILDSKAPAFSLANPFYAKQLELNLAINVFGKNGLWGTYRHLPLNSLEVIPVHHASVNQQIWGDLSTLTWLENPYSPNTKEDIHVFYSSINFRDVMVTTGKLAVEVFEKNRRAQDCVIGLEYSGIDWAGRRIMGIVQSGGLSNIIQIDRDLSWNVPDNWTLEDAATVPVAYATCYYAFYFYGNLKKGDKILIHAGSGGVGQAAINLALYQGCDIFTTVGTPEKRRFILEKFPSIPASHIGNSRDTSFEQLIMQETQGRGVDVVLNSLSEEKLQASIRCLAKGGRFLEIGKFDLVANNTLGMEVFQKGISVHGVMLDKMNDAEKRIRLKNMVNNGLLNGAIKPLTKIVFSKDEVEKAFRYMAAGKHIGKCIIKVRSEGEPINEPILAYPRYYCLRNHSYVIFGGLGGFGLELADWLVLQGATKIVIVSRQGIKDGYQKMRVELWESYGVNVVIISGRDAAKAQDCEFILKTAAELGPVDGIFNLAVALSDCLYTNQTPKTFEDCFRPKAGITKQLDIISRKVCPDLRHFVMFSSVSCGRGNAGQTNYGMANSIMERICERRAAEGLPALAIQWSAIGDVGLVSEMNVGDNEVVLFGMLQQKISSCLQVLNYFLLQKHPVVSSYVLATKRAYGSGKTTIVGTIQKIMGLKSLKTISHHTPLTELGMDSMMAVEIKQTMECNFDTFLTAQDIRNLNFTKLAEMDAKNNNVENHGQVNMLDETLSGMRLLIRTIGKEQVSEDTCLKLQTKRETERDEVFLIPGVEGYASVFSSLALSIKSPCSCLQFGINDIHQKSIVALAQKLLPHILTKIEGRKKFVLAGYSFGSLVAVELARKLEALGISGRLILIDGSPDQLKVLIREQLATKIEEDLQTNILLGIMDMLLPNNSSDLLLDLKNCNGWEMKLDAFMSLFRTNVNGGVKIDENTRRGICTAIYHRLLAIDEYDVSGLPPIRAPITLLKPIIPSTTISEEDFGLRKVTSAKVDVYYVEGNHETMLDNSRVRAAIDGDPIEDANVNK